MDPELLERLKKALIDAEARLNAGGITDEERKSLREMQEQVKGLMEAERLRAEREKKSLVVDLPGSEEHLKDFSFAIAIAAKKFGENVVKGDASHNGYAKQFGITMEIVKATHEKAMSAGQDPAGGILIPVQVASGLIELYRANTFLEKLGLTRIPVSGAGELRFPTETGVGAAYYLGENIATTPTDSSFGDIVMTPKRLTGMCKVSNRLLRNSPMAIEAFVRRRITKDMAQRANLALLTGDGAHAPLGLLSNADIAVYAGATNGDFYRTTDVERLRTELELLNVPTDSLKILTRPEVKRNMKIERVAQYASATTKGQPVFANSIITDAELQERINAQVIVSTLVPKDLTKGSSNDCTYAIVGDFAEVYEATWGGLVLKSSDLVGDNTGSAFTQDQTWILGQMEHDFAVARPESLLIVNDARTSAAVGD